MTSPVWYLACISSLALTVACASEPTDDSSAGAAAGSGNKGGSPSPTAGSGSQGGGAPQACPAGPGRETVTEDVDVGVVSGLIVDDRGEPTSSGLVQVCSKDRCINADVPDTGVLMHRVNGSMNAPACKFGNGKAWGKLAVPLGPRDTNLGTLIAVRLPPFSEAAALEPGGAATSAGVTLTLSNDAKVEVDTLTYEDASEHGFRAAQLPDAALEPLGQDFALGFALSPVETHICPSPALSVENSTALPAGAELELYVLGLDVLEAWAPYAGWQKVGEGVVSDDGQTLEFPDGVPVLTAIGIREKR